MRRLLTGLAAAVICALAGTAPAALVITRAEGGYHAFPADTDDVINAVNNTAPTYGGQTNSGGSLYSSDPTGIGLNNGTIYAGAPYNNTGGGNTYCPANGSSITFTLASPQDIYRVHSISGGQQARRSQRFRLELHSGSWTTIADETQIDFTSNAGNGEMQVVIRDDADAALGTNVDQIRVTYFNTGASLPQSMYRELDVFNTPPPPPPAVVIDDTFGDGNVGTNTDGIGTGFLSAVASNGASVTESGGSIVLTSPIHGAGRARIVSKETADATASETMRFEFEGVSFSDLVAGGTNGLPRLFIGARQSGSLVDADSRGDLGHGFYVTVEDDSVADSGYFGQGGWSGISSFFYLDESNTVTSLATWEFDTLDFTGGGSNYDPTLDITIDLTADSWALDITGDTRDGGLPVSFSGTNSFGGDNNHGLTTGHAYVYDQTEDPDLAVTIDRIFVGIPPTSAIPEPATMAALGLAVAGLARYVRRRKRS